MKAKKKVPIEKIEKMAAQGKDVNSFFSRGQKMPALKDIQRVNVDFTHNMLSELDLLAVELNVSRQAILKTLLMQELDQHRLATVKKRGA